MTPKVNQIPALLLTGFLGAGKTTLLRALLSGADAADTAVIVNEFGEIGLDHHLLVGASETMYLLEIGCVCCTQREDLEASLEELFWARLRRQIPAFSRVVVETTGLADPGRVLAMVTGDTLAGARYGWNSVVRPSGIVVIGSNVTTGVLAYIFAAHGLGQYLIVDDHSGHAHSH